jgi:hypothetical protein
MRACPQPRSPSPTRPPARPPAGARRLARCCSAIFERNHSFLFRGCKGALPSLMNVQMELRKCCNHPFLIKGVEEKELGLVVVNADGEPVSGAGGPGGGGAGTERVSALSAEEELQLLVQSSGKVRRLDRALVGARADWLAGSLIGWLLCPPRLASSCGSTLSPVLVSRRFCPYVYARSDGAP